MIQLFIIFIFFYLLLVLLLQRILTEEHVSQNGKVENETMRKQLGKIRNRQPEGLGDETNRRMWRNGNVGANTEVSSETGQEAETEE